MARDAVVYQPVPAAQAAFAEFWPQSRPSADLADPAPFLARMRALQRRLIEIYRPIMSGPDLARAQRTLAWLATQDGAA